MVGAGILGVAAATGGVVVLVVGGVIIAEGVVAIAAALESGLATAGTAQLCLAEAGTGLLLGAF